MNATKIFWGQVLLVGAVVLVFVWAATEWTAWRLEFQPELGPPWFAVLGWPLYAPPAFFWWWFAYEAYAPGIFIEGAYIAGTGGIAAIIAAVAMSVWRAREAGCCQLSLRSEAADRIDASRHDDDPASRNTRCPSRGREHGAGAPQ